MKILYFAKYRALLGRGSEEVAVPETVKTVAELIDFLKNRDGDIAAAFGDLKTLKIAVDQEHAGLDASVVTAREVAFFPPVTGG